MCDRESLQLGTCNHGMFTTEDDPFDIMFVVWYHEICWDVVTLKKDGIKSRYHTVSPMKNTYECTNKGEEHLNEVLLSSKLSKFKKKKLIYENGISKKNTNVLNYHAECIHFCVFLKELQCSDVYRCLVIHEILKCIPPKKFKYRNYVGVHWHLKDSLPLIIDYEWNFRVTRCLFERQHLDTAMSWLSTLGGACSALGDFDLKFAKRAQKISFQQMNIAYSVGDPAIVARCRLYTAISLIQQHKFKIAKAIIHHEYFWAHSFPKEVRDTRLIKMCHGIWKKLQHERKKTSVKQR